MDAALHDLRPDSPLPSEHRAHAQRAHDKAAAAADALARGLGWLSIGLGLVELLMPRRAAAMAGLRPSAVLPLYGAREIGTGIGLLVAEDKTPWLWARLAGDALDAATLATTLGQPEHRRARTGMAMAVVAGVALLDLQAMHRQKQQATQRRGSRFDYSDRVGLALSPEEMRGAARHPVPVSGGPPG